MMKIPFDPTISADQQFQVLIPEQSVITLTLRWNTRSGAWFADVTSKGKTAYGLKITPRWPLFTDHAALSPISGDLIALPLDGQAAEPVAYDALGTTWGLFWISPDELLKWRYSHGVG